MARYVVHVKGDGAEALAGARFVRDGFSLYALSFGAFWLFAKGTWITALLVLAVQISLAVASAALGLPEWVPMLGFSLVNLFVGLESGALRSWELGLRGFREVAIVAGDDPDQLEQRFFAEKLGDSSNPAGLPAAARAAGPVPVIGLFPSPARRHAVKIALIDYGAGNLHSCSKALERALAVDGREGEVVVGANPDVIASADRLVLPGDGAFKDCRDELGAVDGLEAALHEAVRVKARPFLGICVGMQLLADIGEERGETAGLGWIPGHVVALDPAERHLKVPHMGWNTIEARGSHPILEGVATGERGLHAYFLHSYHLLPKHPADLLAVADYGGAVSAIIGRENIVGTQFHPEKSQLLGLTLLRNFLAWSP